MLLQLGKLGKWTSTTLRITEGGGRHKKCRPFVLASHESYRQFLLAQLPNHFAHIALEWLGKHSNLCMRIKRGSRQRGWGIANAFEIAVEPRHHQKLLKWLTCSEVRKQLHANGAMCSRATLEIAHQYWYTWHMTSEPKSREQRVGSEECPASFWPEASYPLSVCLSVCRSVRIDSLAHWRRKLYGNQIKTAQHFSAFRTPHGHFVHFANKYRTHSAVRATILWTNVKEIFTTATYRQLMKTTPNWFPICCHQLTFRLKLLSAPSGPSSLPAHLPSACQPARSMSSPGLLFEPAKHIKLILALAPTLSSALYWDFY